MIHLGRTYLFRDYYVRLLGFVELRPGRLQAQFHRIDRPPHEIETAARRDFLMRARLQRIAFSPEPPNARSAACVRRAWRKDQGRTAGFARRGAGAPHRFGVTDNAALSCSRPKE